MLSSASSSAALILSPKFCGRSAAAAVTQICRSTKIQLFNTNNQCAKTVYPRFVRAAHSVVQTTDGDTVTIEGQSLKLGDKHLKVDSLKRSPPPVSASTIQNSNSQSTQAPCEECVLCKIGVPVKYDDVLILRQFMREDGSVLPRQATHICAHQQTIIEHSVMQAHWSGLFESLKPPSYDATAAKSEYKKYNRYWNSHEDLFERNVKIDHGSWFYIKRYEKLRAPDS